MQLWFLISGFYRSDVNQGKWFYVCKLILFVNFITFTCVSLFFL